MRSSLELRPRKPKFCRAGITFALCIWLEKLHDFVGHNVDVLLLFNDC